MSEMQYGIVYCAMFQNLSHALKILRPTPHWEWITQLVSTIFLTYSYFLIPKYCHISQQ